MQSAVFRPQYYTEINKTAIISSPPVIIRTFGVNNWMWFKITKSAEKLDNNRENKNSKCKSKCCRPVKTLIKKKILKLTLIFHPGNVGLSTMKAFAEDKLNLVEMI